MGGGWGENRSKVEPVSIQIKGQIMYKCIENIKKGAAGPASFTVVLSGCVFSSMATFMHECAFIHVGQ